MKLEILMLLTETFAAIGLIVSWIIIPNSFVNFLCLIVFFGIVAGCEKLKKDARE